MSISTPGGNQRRPSVVSTGKKAPASKATADGKPDTDDKNATTGGKAGTATKSGPKTGSGRPGGRPAGGGKGGGKGRKPIAPVKVSQGRAWGPIAMFVAVGVLAAGIIGYGAFAAFQGSKPWEDRAADISGITNFRETDPELVAGSQHTPDPVQYTITPPVAGPHNAAWQNCSGDVYDAPIANEHAVHSLEHGAIWITYRPDLPQDQVARLAERVQGTDKTLMSPYEGLDSAISLQAWGYQLKVDDADDSRIDDFIRALRINASIEGPNALCAQGITATGTTPRNIGGGQ
ncbi:MULTISPECIES: DUF3105 domain-containing protein [Polymorphospora]|uniref:DUF3105 domain-containing protein n=1 Tax=Polymorphospora lycopeni TaxID=3140240 RepID=A0ABV5D0C3_9ACTN